MIEAYPLHWPPAWPRVKYPQRSQFRQSYNNAMWELQNELKLLNARDVVISTNLTLRNDGLPRASQRQPDDRGVAVYFKLDGKDQCTPCDKWDSVVDNLWAVAKTINALRGIERWGAKEMVNAAFRGFKALPDGGETIETATPLQILSLEPGATKDEIRTRFRELAHEFHPDRGGDAVQFDRIRKAYEALV